MEQNRYKNLSFHEEGLHDTDSDDKSGETRHFFGYIRPTPLKCPICGELRPGLNHFERRHKESLNVKNINI